MTVERPIPWPDIVAQFAITGQFMEAVPHGNGHINDTFAVTVEDAGVPCRYVLQRINERVFQNVSALMDNFARVTTHVSDSLTLIPTDRGASFARDDQGAPWRCCKFIEGASSHDVVQTPDQARAAAYSFGNFQRQLIDLPGPRLHETIPHFHHTRRRFNQLLAAIETTPQSRLATIRDTVEFALHREFMVDHLLARTARGEIPERITHNDTKINNVMLDDKTGEGVAVIDLDTVMPGLVLYDFGDLVRTATPAAAEDEVDTHKVEARMEIYAALAEGYLTATKEVLTAAEITELEFAGRLITFEIGVRFLTDYLMGNVYFKTHRPHQNLDRARCQFALVRSLEHQTRVCRDIILDNIR